MLFLDINGRIAFGKVFYLFKWNSIEFSRKYVPYDEVRVGCLCDIDGGKVSF